MATKDKDKKDKVVDDDKPTRAGIPRDWVCPPMQISTDIKFCDMKVDMREYTLQLTEYIYYQMVKG